MPVCGHLHGYCKNYKKMYVKQSEILEMLYK